MEEKVDLPKNTYPLIDLNVVSLANMDSPHPIITLG